MTDARPLHLHTVESVCTDLIGGRAISVGTEGKIHSLASETSRAVLNWYFTNRTKWAGNVAVADVDAVVDAAKIKPPETLELKKPTEEKNRSLMRSLAKRLVT